MVEIREVVTKKDLKKFIKFQIALYKDNKYNVPPLIFDEINTLSKDKNPAYESSDTMLWLAYKDGEIVGRIAAIINHTYIEKWDRKIGRFGWVDFIDDMEVSKALFDTAEAWLKENGLEAVHGPLGFNDLDHQGMLVEGFEELDMFITIYNFPYYKDHLEKLGYTKELDWLEFQVTSIDSVPERVKKLNDVVLKRLKLKVIRFKRKKDILKYAESVFELLNEAYKDLPGTVPLSEKQIKHYVKQFFGFVNKDYIRVILDKDGKIAAFGICLPSLSKALQKTQGRLFPFGFIKILKAIKKNTILDLYLVAARPDLQNKGLTALLLYDINKSASENGIVVAETGPELETNESVQTMWKFYDVKQHRRRRCYIKNI
jgi:GNAT superfamily N-acetyltransferase